MQTAFARSNATALEHVLDDHLPEGGSLLDLSTLKAVSLVEASVLEEYVRVGCEEVSHEEERDVTCITELLCLELVELEPHWPSGDASAVTIGAQ